MGLHKTEKPFYSLQQKLTKIRWSPQIGRECLPAMYLTDINEYPEYIMNSKNKKEKSGGIGTGTVRSGARENHGQHVLKIK